MVTVGEFCNRMTMTIGKTDTVLEAARRMRAHHVGSLVIVEQRDGRTIPIGMITDRDIVVGVLATAGPYLDQVEVGEVATDPLRVARENESLVDAIARMRASGVRRMPVVDDAGALVGIVAFDDVLGLVSEELSELGGLMTREQAREAQRRAG